MNDIMVDRFGKEIKVGDQVKILEAGDWTSLVGKICRVVRSDNPEKVKVEYDETWQGYHKPSNLEKIIDVKNLKLKVNALLDELIELSELRGYKISKEDFNICKEAERLTEIKAEILSYIE